MTSSIRPMIQKYPLSSRFAASPAVYIPFDSGPVGVEIALSITVDASEHSGPRFPDHQKSLPGRWEAPAPASSTIAASTPRTGRVQEPGTVGVAAGCGEIMWPPVSVCHQVSTMGHFVPPIISWYHIQASGLMGSPTVPSTLRLERSCFRGMFVAPFHEGADRGGCGVESGRPCVARRCPRSELHRVNSGAPSYIRLGTRFGRMP